MTIVSAITELHASILGVTPMERLGALKSFGGDSHAEGFYILLGIAAIIVLTGILVNVNLSGAQRKKIANDNLFIEYSERRGLALRECQVLLSMAINAGLKRNEAIFTDSSVFDRGAVWAVEKCLIANGVKPSEQLRMELSILREKLGFEIRKDFSKVGIAPVSADISSRQIPEGKTVYLKHHNTTATDDIEAIVIKNDDKGLTVEFADHVEIVFGDIWRGHYCASDCLWEFDTSVISCSGDIVVLKHSEQIRRINRRRFLRVPVRRPAYVASFPFMESQVKNPNKSNIKSVDASKKHANILEPPKFIPAVIIELGGPGLLVKANLEVSVGDRVLLAFKLRERRGTDSASGSSSKDKTKKVVKDIGTVKHVKSVDGGFVMAVELQSLSDANISKLVRATNAAFISTRKRNPEMSTTTVSNAVLQTA